MKMTMSVTATLLHCSSVSYIKWITSFLQWFHSEFPLGGFSVTHFCRAETFSNQELDRFLQTRQEIIRQRIYVDDLYSI